VARGERKKVRGGLRKRVENDMLKQPRKRSRPPTEIQQATSQIWFGEGGSDTRRKRAQEKRSMREREKIIKIALQKLCRERRQEKRCMKRSSTHRGRRGKEEKSGVLGNKRSYIWRIKGGAKRWKDETGK